MEPSLSTLPFSTPLFPYPLHPLLPIPLSSLISSFLPSIPSSLPPFFHNFSPHPSIYLLPLLPFLFTNYVPPFLHFLPYSSPLPSHPSSTFLSSYPPISLINLFLHGLLQGVQGVRVSCQVTLRRGPDGVSAEQTVDLL